MQNFNKKTSQEVPHKGINFEAHIYYRHLRRGFDPLTLFNILLAKINISISLQKNGIWGLSQILAFSSTEYKKQKF